MASSAAQTSVTGTGAVPPHARGSLSRRMILRPGDIIATGTPSGVGAPRGIFLKAGDTIRMEVEKIGSMTNSFV